MKNRDTTSYKNGHKMWSFEDGDLIFSGFLSYKLGIIIIFIRKKFKDPCFSGAWFLQTMALTRSEFPLKMGHFLGFLWNSKVISGKMVLDSMGFPHKTIKAMFWKYFLTFSFTPNFWRRPLWIFFKVPFSSKLNFQNWIYSSAKGIPWVK